MTMPSSTPSREGRKIAIGAVAFLAASAGALACRWWPDARLGWLELAGRPLALDGQRVADWRHVNELLARSATDIWAKSGAFWEGRETPAAEILDRQFVVDYQPAGREQRERVVVDRFMVWSRLDVNRHPIGAARYAVVAASPMPAK